MPASAFVHASSTDCHDRWLQRRGSKRPHGHITFRDKASQGMCKSARPNLQDVPSEAEEPRAVGRPAADGLQGDSTGELDPPEEETLLTCEPDAEPPPEDVGEVDADDLQELPEGTENGTEPEEDDDHDEEQREEPREPTPPEEKRLSLTEYKEKWDRLFQNYARPVRGSFADSNLVPKPVPQLFQNCPWVPFDVLTADDASDEAHARLSRCFPLSGLQRSSMADGIERYAHCQGEVNFRRRAPMQVAATLGFVLGQRSGSFLKGLKPKELDAIHEILVWGRQPLNNKILEATHRTRSFLPAASPP